MPSPSSMFVWLAVSPEAKVYWYIVPWLSTPQLSCHVECTHPPHTANEGVTGQVQLPVGQLAINGVTEAVRAPLYVAAIKDRGGCSASLISFHSA